MNSEIPSSSPYSPTTPPASVSSTKKVKILRWWHIAVSILIGIVIGVASLGSYALFSYKTYEKQRDQDKVTENILNSPLFENSEREPTELLSHDAIDELSDQGVDIEPVLYTKFAEIACRRFDEGMTTEDLAFLADGVGDYTAEDSSLIAEAVATYSCPEHKDMIR